VLQRQAIADRRRRVRTAHHLSARLQAGRAEDVTLFAIDVVQQSDAGTAIRIVLDRIDLGRHAVFVATEIDQTQVPLVTAAAMTRGDPALIVAATLAPLGSEQALLRLRARRELSEVADARPAAAWSRRIVSANTHSFSSCS